MSDVENWRSAGLCASLEFGSPMWEMFFGDCDVDRRPARNYCGRCPVREDCLRAALENKEIWGVWGGCDEADLRRALWVDANGDPAPRSRFPQCPCCKARPSNLSVAMVCDLRTRRRRERVSCAACGFYWHSASSAVAVRAYWKDRRRKVQARSVASRRLPGVGRGGGSVIPLRGPEAVSTDTAVAASVALVASAVQRRS